MYRTSKQVYWIIHFQCIEMYSWQCCALKYLHSKEAIQYQYQHTEVYSIGALKCTVSVYLSVLNQCTGVHNISVLKCTVTVYWIVQHQFCEVYSISVLKCSVSVSSCVQYQLTEVAWAMFLLTKYPMFSTWRKYLSLIIISFFIIGIIKSAILRLFFSPWMKTSVKISPLKDLYW